MYGGGWGGMYNGGWCGLHGGVGGIGMMIFWILLLVLGFFALRHYTGRTGSWHGPGLDETPLEILRKRYAKGEISEEEYERMRDKLRQ